MSTMKTCRDCEHAAYDERWGEYKCKKFETRLYKPGLYTLALKNADECPGFKEKSKK